MEVMAASSVPPISPRNLVAFATSQSAAGTYSSWVAASC